LIDHNLDVHLDVGLVFQLNMGIMRIHTTFGELWEVPFVTMNDYWINYVNKEVYGSILTIFIKDSNEYSITLIMGIFYAF